MAESTLFPSSNRGRYQVGNLPDAPDLTGDSMIEVLINGQWIRGRVEYAGSTYVVEKRLESGYYVVFPDRSIIGLCVGMRVRTLPSYALGG